MAGYCISCAWKNGVSAYKQQKLLDDAKQMAKDTGKFQVIIYDEDDKSFETMEEDEAKGQGLDEFIYTTISPY